MQLWLKKSAHTFSLLTCLTILSGCNSTGTDTSARESGNIANTSISIAGKIVAEGAENADVTVRMGGLLASGKANSSGEYFITLPIPIADEDTPIELVGHLTGERSYVALASNLGKAKDVIEQAGIDATLRFEENPRANISSVSTAEAALLRELGIARSKSLNFATEVDAQATLNLASAIELLIQRNNEFQLPNGTETTLQLAYDQSAREDFLQHLKNNNFEVVQNATLSILGNLDIFAAAEGGA